LRLSCGSRFAKLNHAALAKYAIIASNGTTCRFAGREMNSPSAAQAMSYRLLRAIIQTAASAGQPHLLE
jgi:hypothetical protein